MRLSKVIKRKPAPRLLVQIEVYSRLRDALLEGRFRPGEVLSIRKLAMQLGTSTMPVREAVSRLVSERALEMRSNQGVRIPVLTRTRANEIFEARIALEGLAVHHAAQCIDLTTLAELEDIQRDLDRSASAGNLSVTVNYNLKFHFTLNRACGSATLVALIDSLYLQWVPTLVVAMERMRTQKEFIHTHHTLILEALRARDPAAARQALERDLSDFNLSETIKAIENDR